MTLANGTKIFKLFTRIGNAFFIYLNFNLCKLFVFYFCNCFFLFLIVVRSILCREIKFLVSLNIFFVSVNLK